MSLWHDSTVSHSLVFQFKPTRALTNRLGLGEQPQHRKNLTCHIVTKSNGCQGDNHKIDGVQSAPAFYVLEYDGGKSHKEDTAEQDEDDGGNDANLGLTNIPFLQRQSGVGGRQRLGPRPQEQATQCYHVSTLLPALLSFLLNCLYSLELSTI